MESFWYIFNLINNRLSNLHLLPIIWYMFYVYLGTYLFYHESRIIVQLYTSSILGAATSSPYTLLYDMKSNQIIIEYFHSKYKWYIYSI